MTDHPRKVAVVGTAPSTFSKAPVKDDSWEIWAVGPGIFKELPRCDRWFEIHVPQIYEEYPEYWNDLAEFDGQTLVFGDIKAKHPVKYPKAEMEEKYGQWFFTSSMAWMLALAIEELKPGDFIGLWGVDISIDSEYAYQRPGVLHFLDLAQRKGIKVVIPAESELLIVSPVYPGQSIEGMRLRKRRDLLEAGLKEAKAEIRKYQLMEAHLEGALEEMKRFGRYFITEGT